MNLHEYMGPKIIKKKLKQLVYTKVFNVYELSFMQN
jgi:hypothetical protein